MQAHEAQNKNIWNVKTFEQSRCNGYAALPWHQLQLTPVLGLLSTSKTQIHGFLQ